MRRACMNRTREVVLVVEGFSSLSRKEGGTHYWRIVGGIADTIMRVDAPKMPHALEECMGEKITLEVIMTEGKPRLSIIGGRISPLVSAMSLLALAEQVIGFADSILEDGDKKAV